MRFRLSSLFFLFLAATLVFGSGCRRQKPTTPADDSSRPQPAAAAESPAPAPSPTPQPEDDGDPLSGDLESVNAYLQREGLLGDVLFDYDRSELRAPERDRIARNGRFLQEQPSFLVTIEGHCDERGTNEYNLALGERRASAVKDYLVALGVPADRLTTVSYGEERPVCAGSDEGCWQQNRRAHHVVTGRRGR